MSLWRPEFEVALRVFATVSETVEASGFQRPVLVGGAAVEFYSGSVIATGDFDVVTARQDVSSRASPAWFCEARGSGRVLLAAIKDSGTRW